MKGWQAWRTSAERPDDIPSTPDQVYKHDGWQGYAHWVGSGTVRKDTSVTSSKRPGRCVAIPLACYPCLWISKHHTGFMEKVGLDLIKLYVCGTYQPVHQGIGSQGCTEGQS